MRAKVAMVGLALGAAIARPAAADALSPEQVIATYCTENPYECTSAPLFYSKTIELPIAFDFDTGWIPQGSDLQVRFFVKLPASTTVELDGALDTTWPEAMKLATPGGEGGLLKFDYGLDVGAEAKIDVNVLGIPVSWTGDIPFVPQVDWHMKGETTFRSWAFGDEPASASGTSPEVRLFEVNLMSLAGIPSQISKGGVALDVAGELEATYQTDRIRIEQASDPNQPPITSQEGTTTRAFAGGPFVEYDVWPEGRVSYTGTLHLIPTLFIEVLGKDFDMPIFDFPVSMPIGDQDFVFDPVRVHVPLPDLAPATPDVVDFGDVNVGDGRILTVTLENDGEAKARANGFVESEQAEIFTLTTPEVFVEPAAQGTIKIRFEPQAEGEFEAELTLVTNDPDTRFQTVMLRGNAVTSGAPVYGDNDPERVTSNNDAGCGCATPGSSSSPGALAAFGLLGVALALGRARRSVRHAV